VFLDIGGNTGAYSVKAAQFFRSHGGGTVVTYEPLPDVLATLNHNVAANGFDNVRLRSFCLGAQPGTADFWFNFNRPASSGLVSLDPRAARRSVLVLRLDDVFPLEQLGRLDYAKIDVEGAEGQVLAGANETFKKFRPIIQLETCITDVRLDLAEYSAWQSPSVPNKVCIPNGNPKAETARQLSWRRIS
jgi:FkbM family methyltransferase